MSIASHPEDFTGLFALFDQDVDGCISAQEVERILATMAGDHSTAPSTIAGIRRAHPDRRLGVVWIDAHADIH